MFRTYIEPQMSKLAFHWMLSVEIAPGYSLGVQSERAKCPRLVLRDVGSFHGGIEIQLSRCGKKAEVH